MSAGVITSGTVNFHFQLSGFPASAAVVGAHIHSAPAGVIGGVIVSTGIAAASPVSATGGITSFTATTIAVGGATIQAIVDNPAGHYFNVHSALNPGGFARGQLSRTL